MDRTASFSSTEVIFTLLLPLIVFYVTRHLFRRNTKRLPPGPTGLPLVGNLLFFAKNPHLKFLELRKKYGPIYSVKLGSNNIVVLCDYQSVRCALLQDAFSGLPPNIRSQNNTQTETYDAEKSVQEWAEQKRFYFHLMKDLGFGRSKTEEYVKEEICYMLDILKKNDGQPLAVDPILNPSMSNNIASLVFGRRMDSDDPKRIMLNQFLSDTNKLSGEMAIAAFFPWIMPLMRWLRIGNLHKLDEINAKMAEFFCGEIEEHERTLDPENIRDFIDGFLVEMQKRKGQPNSKFTKSILQESAQAFFAAGTDTVRFTIGWLLLTMAAFADVQKRIQKEIDEVIGPERFPVYKDHSEMPFTQSVIMEIMRWRNVFPLNYFRYTVKDAEINSVFIPKDTYIFINTWSLSHDPVLWGSPDCFRPERFLTNEGKAVKKPEYYIPFSIGKRACPGESFASIETFLYLTAILQKFSVNPPEGTAIDLDGDLALSLQPKPQKLVFTLRH